MEAILKLAAAPAEADPAPAAGPELRLESVSKSWGPRRVIDDVTLELAPGSLTWLAGSNGVGKTTLLRVAAGLVAPDQGTVEFDGLHPRRNRRAFQRRLGFLSAGDRGIYARLSVYDHLKLWARLALLPGGEIDDAIRSIVQRVGIEELLPSRVDRMSMGQRQRLRVAMTFLHSPDLVLLDEPLTSLDEQGAAVLRDCIGDVLARSGVVLWCSPGTDREYAPFDRHLWLQDARITEIA